MDNTTPFTASVNGITEDTDQGQIWWIDIQDTDDDRIGGTAKVRFDRGAWTYVRASRELDGWLDANLQRYLRRLMAEGDYTDHLALQRMIEGAATVVMDDHLEEYL